VIPVVFNPAAGPALVRKIGQIRELFAARGVPFRLLETRAPGDAVTLAREAAFGGAKAVVAVGGDGTVNEVVNGLAGTSVRLLILPHGTGNVAAAELGLPSSPERCLDLLDSGRTLRVPLARAGGRYFLLMASAGFDAEVVERLAPGEKRALGRAAYLLAGLRHLARPQPTLWIELPGRERFEAQAVLFCRGSRYAGTVLVPGARLEDGVLRLVALRRTGRAAIASFAWAVWRGRAAAWPGVTIREIDSALVRSRIPSAVQVDGEYAGPLPARFSRTDVTVDLVVPAGGPAR